MIEMMEFISVDLTAAIKHLVMCIQKNIKKIINITKKYGRYTKVHLEIK